MLFNPINSFKTNLGNMYRIVQFYLSKITCKKRSDGVSNIYFVTVHKCGSQWIKDIFSDKKNRMATGMSVYPQHHYDINEFKVKFPRNTFIPGLYFSEACEK